jgi:hypothetical protein
LRAGTVTAQTITRHQPPPPASRDAFTFADLKAQMPQRADGTFLMEVPSLYFSAGDPAARQVIEGQSVETTAQLRPDPSYPALFQLTRSLTRCCSADSRAYSIVVEPATAMPSLPDGAWVSVTGTISYRREIGGYGPVIHSATIHQVPPPAIPILK